MDEIRKILHEIQEIYDLADRPCHDIESILPSNEETILAFITSNDLWGGAGSIADQGLIDLPAHRRKLESRLIELGELQIAIGKTNARTQQWVDAFKAWHEDPDRILRFHT